MYNFYCSKSNAPNLICYDTCYICKWKEQIISLMGPFVNHSRKKIIHFRLGKWNNGASWTYWYFVVINSYFLFWYSFMLFSFKSSIVAITWREKSQKWLGPTLSVQSYAPLVTSLEYIKFPNHSVFHHLPNTPQSSHEVSYKVVSGTV